VGVEIAEVGRLVPVGVDAALGDVGDGVAVRVAVAQGGDAGAVGVGRVGQQRHRHRLAGRRQLGDVGDVVAVVVGVHVVGVAVAVGVDGVHGIGAGLLAIADGAVARRVGVEVLEIGLLVAVAVDGRRARVEVAPL